MMNFSAAPESETDRRLARQIPEDECHTAIEAERVSRNGTPTARLAGWREWIGLAVIALPCVLYSMDLTVLYLALPRLSADLAPSSTQLLWITDIYGFLLAGLLITMGTLGDRIGRRRLLLTGAAAFGAASVLAAFSTSAEMLIGARALQGVAAATLAPSTLSLIRNMFLDERQRTVAVGIWIASFSVGAAIGPLVGGALLQLFWWGSVFLAAVPVMALLLVLGPMLLPEFRDPAPGRLDLASAALSLIGILALIYGLKQIAAFGIGARALLALAVGAVVAFVFVRRQLALAEPLLDVRLFRRAAFATAVAAMGVAVFVVAGTDFFLGQYLQLVHGKTPLEAGLWLLPGVAGLVAGSLLAPAALRRVSVFLVLTAGLAIAAAGAALLAGLGVGSGLELLVLGTTLIGIGAGAVGTLATDFVVGTAPAERAGAASAITETGAELGGALGVAILGSIGAAVYRGDLAAAAPNSLSPAKLDAAQDSLAGAIEIATTVPARVNADVVDAASAAFVHGLRLGALTAAGLAALLSLFAGFSLRSKERSAIPDPTAAPPR
jgi:DHA2 family multidrug resistance protein-like MFS transporter